LKAIRRILGEQPPAHFVVLRRELGSERRGLGRVDVQDARVDLERIPAAECSAPREALVEHAAEGEEIAPPVDRTLRDLLGRHVARRPRDDRFGRDRGLALRGGRRRGLGQRRDAEVQQLRPSLGRHHDVLRLEVAMDDPTLVRGGEAVGELGHEYQRIPDGHQPALELRRERLSLHVLHDDACLAVGLDLDVVDGADGGVVERRGRLRFAHETLARGGVAEPVGGDEFDRHIAAQGGVVGEVHRTHAAGAERTNQTVLGAGLERVGGHRRAASDRAGKPPKIN
jgi:hypothetical protein